MNENKKYVDKINENKKLISELYSIDNNGYEKIITHPKWLKDVILLVENVPVSVSISLREKIKNITHPLVYVNKSFETLTGYKRNEIVGKNCNFLQGTIHEDENTTKLEISNKLKEGSFCKFLMTNYKNDGTAFRNFIILFPIKYECGEILYFIGLQCDITNPKTPYNYITFMDELYNIIPKIINKDDNLIQSNMADIFESIGIYKDIEEKYPIQEKSIKNLYFIPNCRKSIIGKLP